MAKDKNGAELAAGDRVIVSGTVLRSDAGEVIAMRVDGPEGRVTPTIGIPGWQVEKVEPPAPQVSVEASEGATAEKTTDQ